MMKKLFLVLLAFVTGDSLRAEVAKALPAVGGSAWYYMTLNEWVALATLGYIALQAAYLLWKWRREAK